VPDSSGGRRGRDCKTVRFIPIPMQSLPITTSVVSSNPFHARCTRFNIMW